MSINLSCFNNIIGLSRTPCNCYPAKPVGTDISVTNTFLDEQDGIFLDTVKALGDCQTGNLWEHMIWAREEAINQYITEIKNCIELNTLRTRPFFSGTLGNDPFVRDEQIQGMTFAGQAWALANVRGATITIKRIGAAFNQTGVGNITVKIYDNLDAAPLYTIPLNTTQDVMNWNTTNISIPMSTRSRENKYLYLVYQLPAGWLPKEMNSSCGCSTIGQVNVWCWDRDGCKPSFAAAPNGDTRYDWLKWMLLAGIRVNGSLNSSTRFASDWNLKGLLFDIDISCETDSILCTDSLSLADPLTFVHAYAIRYKAASLLYSRLLSTPILSRYVTKNREYMNEQVPKWDAQYQQRILYACDRIADKHNLNRYNDCLTCKEAFPITKGKILK